MKRGLLALFLLLLISNIGYSQACIPNAEITTTDSLLCFGDTTTLNFTASTVDSVTITSPPINNNGQDGNMFDITATNTIRIKYFEGNIANTPSPTTDYYIYYKVGTHVGFENNPGAWTLLAGPISFNPNAPNTYTRIPYNLNLTIPIGQTYAFYLTNTSAISNNNRYHNGTATGAVLATNADLTLYEGTGGAYPFGTFFNARPWEGNIIYDYPVSYLWSTGATTSSLQVNPTADSLFSCVVSVGTVCTVEDTIFIQVNHPQVSLGNDTSICEGSNLTLDAENPGAIYNWCDGSNAQTVNVVVPGLHCVTVTDAIGCTASDSITVNILSLPTVFAGVTDTLICISDSVVFTGSGSGITYIWDNGVTDGVLYGPTSTDDYVVTGTDGNGCSNYDTVSVTVNPFPNVNITGDSVVCLGEGTLLTASGANTYIWLGGSTSNPSSFFLGSSELISVMGTDTTTGCSAMDTIGITVNFLPVVNLGADIVQPDPPAVLDAGSGFSSYLWSTSAVTQTISVNTNGTFNVTVTDANGCSASDTINVTFTAGIFNNNGEETIIQLYPNPTDGIFNLQIQNLETSEMKIEITDLNGNVIKIYTPEIVNESYLRSYDVTPLSSGVYILKISANGYSSSLRFVKK